jgi:hypothetical protein
MASTGGHELAEQPVEQDLRAGSGSEVVDVVVPTAVELLANNILVSLSKRPNRTS